LLQNSFNQAWVPYVFNGLKESNESLKLKIVKWTYIYFVGILLIALLFYLFTPVIFLFLGKAFHEGISVVLWISLGFAFNGMYKMVSVYFFYLDKTLAIAIISVLTAIINIAFVIWLVPRYAFQGAAFGTMLAFFIQFIGTWIWSTRIINMPWGNWKALWKK
jgi:O-antigen/teichoic acid export membrane protein